METITVDEILRDPNAFLNRIQQGVVIAIVSGNQAIAKVTPLEPTVTGSRPFGLAAGEFTVPDDFDQPLPDDVLAQFEGKK